MSAFNGSGTFVISGTGLPFVANTTISSTVVNTLDSDLATGLSNCICKDGQSTPTANIPLGGFKLTNVGAATTANDALTYGTGTHSSTLLVPTRQVLTSGSSATYTTPAGVRQLRIRLCGGGGGDTTFNSITAKGGSGGAGGTTAQSSGGVGGTGGSGSASWRSAGQGGNGGGQGTNGAVGASGGSSVLGGGARSAVADEDAAGYGGGGGGGQSATAGYSGGGGGGGEYVEIVINSPSATYTYTVGAGGTKAALAGSYDGGNGKQGIIIVEEFY